MKTKTALEIGNVRRPALTQAVNCITREEYDYRMPVTGVSSERTITYSENGRQEINFCDHRCRLVADWPIAPWLGTKSWSVSGSPGAYSYSYASRSGLYDVSATVDKRFVTVEERGEPSAQEEAMAVYDAASRVYMLGIPRIMNTPLAFIELRDVHGTLKSAVELVKFVGLAQTRVGKFAWLANATVKQVASAYLAYNFGIKPTIGDVNRFMKGFEKGTSALIQQKPITRKRNERVRAQFNFGLIGGLPLPTVAVVPDVHTLVLTAGQTSSDTSCIYSSLTGVWPSTALRVIRGTELRGLAFGRLTDDVTLDADPIMNHWACPVYSTAWQLVKFSFLVDWVYDISSFLDSLERRLTVREGSLAFGEGLWTSISRHTVEKAPVLDHSVGYTVSSFDKTHGVLALRYVTTRALKGWKTVDESIVYRRTPISTLVPPMPQLGGRFKTYQLSTAAALLAGLLPDVKAVRARIRR